MRMRLMKRKPYPSDLTDGQWAILAPHMPAAAKRGAPRRVELREIVNALLYLNRSGCQWRMLPHDFPDSVDENIRQSMGDVRA